MKLKTTRAVMWVLLAIFLCVNVTYGLDKVCTLRLCSNCHYYCLWNNKYCVLALP